MVFRILGVLESKLVAVVYHGSNRRGLTRLDPCVSTHGHAFVYAVRVPAQAIAFLGNVDDLHVAKEIAGTQMEITERHANALAKYQGIHGSVYTLPGDAFETGQTNWENELVSTQSVAVLSEWRVEDALQELLHCETKGTIRIYRYPDRPNYIPEDDSDLVEKAAIFASWRGNEVSIRKRCRQYHPHLVERLDALIGSPYLVALSKKHGIPFQR